MKKAINQSLMAYILNGVSILALLFLVYSLFDYGVVNGKLDQAHEERFELTYNANRFMNGSAYLTNEVRAYAATGIQEHYDNYWNEINNLKNRDIGVANLQEIGITQEEQAMIDDMSALSNELVPLEEEAMKNVQAGKREDAVDYVYGSDYSTAITKINSLKEQFLGALDTRTSQQVAVLTKKTQLIRLEMILAFVIVGISQLISILTIRLRVLKPVVKVRDQMREISQGNLSAQFTLEPDTSEIGMLTQSILETKRELKKYINDINAKLSEMAKGNMDQAIGDDYRGEFQPIQHAMAEILDSLNEALAQIDVTARQVSQESRRMATDAQVLSSGAVEQASAVQQLSASIQDISGQVESTSRDANRARNSANDASSQLQICNEKMMDMTAAMEDISRSSNQIGGIIKTIESISFQTNILALNAAVEAARAGEAGKGFAVVADEVRSLANKSSDAAHDITQLIEESMKLVDQGTALSDETTKALMGVMVGAKDATEMIERIAVAADSQSQSIKQVTLGMEQISEVVQTNASTAEKSAASAEELYGQAEEMLVAVQRFKLRGRR
ncbi:MAG: methyl-accepting chemotaxis protein [Lachnospiraceae bacterium]|jgi:methyl-accepting chemotaxis protein|nr:methyl-accepting chemotaxis protein [Lachnospiraceae bacterium]